MKAHEFILEAPLAPTLFKYTDTKRDRVPILLNKIKDLSPFTILTPRGRQEVVIDPNEYNKVLAWTKNPAGRLRLKLQDSDETIPLGAIIKTREFGGESSGHRERIELGQLANIDQQIQQIKGTKPYIVLAIGPNTVHAARAGKTPGLPSGRAPKSDMTIYDEHNRPVAWVSLKDRTFRWGGWTHLSQEPEIQAFVSKIREITGGQLGPKQAYGLHPSSRIIEQIVYGKNFGGSFGPSNVNCVLIGDPQIQAQGDIFTLTATHVYFNGDVPTAQHEPYLTVRYMLARNDLGLKNARAETNIMGEGRKVQWLGSDL